MIHFPDFIKNQKNHINSNQKNPKDIDGYYFEGIDGSQIAFWSFYSDRISKIHIHEFDEYMVCVCGKYTVIMNAEEIVMNVGSELFIPKGTLHAGICIPGTRTIHVFGGKRIQGNKE